MSLDALEEAGVQFAKRDDEEFLDKVELERVRIAVDKLPEKYREIVLLRYVNEEAKGWVHFSQSGKARFAGHMSEAHDHLATVRGDENGNVAQAAVVSDEIETSLKAKLKVASELLAEGRADFEAEEFERAYGKFVASFKASQEAKAEIKVREDVDVRIEVDGGVGIGIGVGRDKDEDDDRDEDEEKSKDKDSDEDKDNGEGNDDKDEAKLKIKIDAEADEDGDVDLKINEKLKIK